MTTTISTNGHTNGKAATLYPSHLAELRASGLTDETIHAAGIRSESNRTRLAEILNRRSWPPTMGSGLVIPIVDAEGTVVSHRIKPERPGVRNGKAAKYLSPSKEGVRLYFALGSHKLIADGATEIIITEGEKKSLCVAQYGFASISLPGVDCWHGKNSTAPLAELERIDYKARTVYLAFDSDAATNANVVRNECLLAAALQSRGAKVKVVRFPAGPNGEKVGVDDYIVANGIGEFRKLLDAATDPESLPPEAIKALANEGDPADIAVNMRAKISAGGIPRIIYWRGQWWYWEHGGYRELSHDDMRARVVDHIVRDYIQVKSSHVSNVIEHLKSQSLIPSHIDAPLWLAPKSSTDYPPLECVSTSTGVVHLPSYANERPCVIAASPRFFTTAGVGYPFDDAAGQPTEWLKFLKSVYGDDWQSIATLQQFFGYCLTLDTSLQKLLLIVGPKRSGKGTILRILRKLVGDRNVAAPTLSGLTDRFGLWPLIGKSLAVISDARLSGRADQAVITERILSISGEDAQTIDRKNLEPLTIKLSTRFVIVTNELPRLGDASGALVSRMIMLRTMNSFYGREDTSLTDKLLAELPGIFLWAIDGWKVLREQGRFTQPDSGLELLCELSDLSSPVSAFVREKCHVSVDASVPVDDLFRSWKYWCEGGGKMRPTDKATFGRDLLALLPNIRKVRPHREDGGRVYEYVGIGLLIDTFRS